MPLGVPLMLLAILSVIQVMILLCRKGSSQSLKQKILKQYLIYLLIFVIYYDQVLLDITMFEDYTINPFLNTKQIIFSLFGVLMVSIRIIFDPYLI